MPSLSLAGQSRQRQIAILAAGGAVLGGLLLFQLPKTLERLNPPSTAETSETAPAPATPTPQPAAAPAAPVVPVATTPAPRRALLARFDPKDPFIQQVNPDAASATQASADSAPAGAAVPSQPSAAISRSARAALASARRSRSASGGATFTVESFAVISVNGDRERVRVSGTFPKGDPVFRLVSASGGTARVGIAGGNLTGGGQTVTLTRGQPLTLLNTVDGKRYKLELLSVSS